jgi:hypothetical protein
MTRHCSLDEVAESGGIAAVVPAVGSDDAVEAQTQGPGAVAA